MYTFRSGFKISREIQIRQKYSFNDLWAICKRSAEKEDRRNASNPSSCYSTATTLYPKICSINSLPNTHIFNSCLLCRETTIGRPSFLEIQTRSYSEKKSNVRLPYSTRKEPCKPETENKDKNGKPDKNDTGKGNTSKNGIDQWCGKKPPNSKFASINNAGKTHKTSNNQTKSGNKPDMRSSKNKNKKDPCEKKPIVDECKEEKEDPCKKKPKEDKRKEEKEDPCKKKPKEDECTEEKEDPCKKKSKEDECKEDKEDPCETKSKKDECEEEKVEPTCKRQEREEPPCREKTKEEIRCEHDPSKANNLTPQVIPCPVPTEDKTCRVIPYKLAPGELEAWDLAKPNKECEKPKALKRGRMCDEEKPEPKQKTDCFSKKGKEEEDCKESDDPCIEKDPCKEESASKNDDPCEEEAASKKADPCKDKSSKKKDDPCKKKESSKKDPCKENVDDPCDRTTEETICPTFQKARPPPSCKNVDAAGSGKDQSKEDGDQCVEAKEMAGKNQSKQSVDQSVEKKETCNKEESKCPALGKARSPPSCKTAAGSGGQSVDGKSKQRPTCKDVREAQQRSEEKNEHKPQDSFETNEHKPQDSVETKTPPCAVAETDSKTLVQALVHLLRKLLGSETNSASVRSKEDPCKLMFEEDEKRNGTSKKEDPCKKEGPLKKEDSRKEEDPCKKEKDPCKKESPLKKEDSRKDPCKKEEDPCKKEEDPCKKEEDPCKKEEDPFKKEDDPCKKEDPSKTQNPKCKKMKFHCPDFSPLKPAKNVENPPCEGPKEEICEKEEDPCKKEDDPCEKEKVEDPCEKEKDPCEKDEDPCEEEKDPCEKDKDPCEKKNETSKENKDDSKTDSKKLTCKDIKDHQEKEQKGEEEENGEDKDDLCADKNTRDLIEIQMKNIFSKSQKKSNNNKK